MRKHSLLYLFTLLLVGCAVQRQSLVNFIEAGDRAASQDDYYSAAEYYQIALEYDGSREDVRYKWAESAQAFNAFRTADSLYRIVAAGEWRDSFPLLTLHLGEVNYRLGNYDEAVKWYEQFLQEQSDADAGTRREAERGLTNSEWAADAITDSTQVVVRHVSNDINTPYSDFALTPRGDDTLYFTSYRFDLKKDTLNPARNLFKIVRKIGDKPAEPLDEDINLPNKNVGHTAFNTAGTRVYFTICDYTDNVNIRCDLYASDVDRRGRWGTPKAQAINVAGATTTQPNVGRDPRTGEEFLYFASDRAGGRGGLDLYRSTINEDGSLGEPQNLRDLNTAGNEITPYYYEPMQALYFSADNVDTYLTLGGYDVFRSFWNGEEWTRPENLRAPLNSSYSDVYFARPPDREAAFMASNRPDSAAIFWDETRDACCYDIYNLDLPQEVRLIALTFNRLDNSPLAGCTVELYEMTASGERLLVRRLNPDSNDFYFMLEPAKRYEVRATRPNFTSDVAEVDLTDPALVGQSEIKRELYLAPGLLLEAFTFRRLDSVALNQARVALYELTDTGPVYVDSLYKDNTNRFPFIIQPSRVYELRAERDGYAPTRDTVDLRVMRLAEGAVVERRLYLGQELTLYTFNGGNNQPLTGVEVEIQRIENGRPVTFDKRTKPDGYRFDYTTDLELQYIVKAKRQGFEDLTDTLRFTVQQLATSGGRLVDTIYLTPSSLDQFLPLALYFDNDQPDPRTLRRVTAREYMETNRAYYGRKDEFIRNFVATLDQEQAFLARGQFNDFFDREVRGGATNLEAFSEELLNYLQAGNSFTMRLIGFASPRAGSEYNLRLSERRIDAVQNYFERYRNGVLMPYINNGRLKFKTEPVGENTAKLDPIYEELSDPRSSIFSVVASLERRVEIRNADANEGDLSAKQ